MEFFSSYLNHREVDTWGNTENTTQWWIFVERRIERKLLLHCEWYSRSIVSGIVKRKWKHREGIFSDNKLWIMEKSLVEITSHGIWTECCKCNKGYTDGLAEQELEGLFSMFPLLS